MSFDERKEFSDRIEKLEDFAGYIKFGFIFFTAGVIFIAICSIANDFGKLNAVKWYNEDCFVYEETNFCRSE